MAECPLLLMGGIVHFPQQYLYFLPEPQGQDSLRPTFLPAWGNACLVLGWPTTFDMGEEKEVVGMFLTA